MSRTKFINQSPPPPSNCDFMVVGLIQYKPCCKILLNQGIMKKYIYQNKRMNVESTTFVMVRSETECLRLEG